MENNENKYQGLFKNWHVSRYLQQVRVQQQYLEVKFHRIHGQWMPLTCHAESTFPTFKKILRRIVIEFWKNQAEIKEFYLADHSFPTTILFL